MPPKPKFSKNEIIRSALDLVREKGPESLTAREVGKRLGVSSSPIFTFFKDMDELKNAVKVSAKEKFDEYMLVAENFYPSYKKRGMQFVRFAGEEPQLFKQIRQWIRPEDFEEGLYRTVAKELYEQMEKDELEPARIIGHFTEVEEQNKVASMFQTSFGSEIQNDEKKKAITDLILKIKEHSIERQAGEITDLNELQKLVQQKKMLQGAVKLHIS